MTDLEYTQWLSSPTAVRCILVEATVNVGGSEITRYFSDKGYTTGASDTPANTNYTARIVGGVKISEKLSLESSATISWGDIELDNSSGVIDDWLNDVWLNRNITVYFGDMRWARSDFRVIFKGLCSGIGSSNRSRLNITLADSLQRLNTPMSDIKLGGSSTNKDRLIPLCFGECHNVSPLLTSQAGHEYQVHNGAIEDIIEVRDNGAPITVTKVLGSGKFTLANSPAGTITASVQGAKPSVYTNNIAETIKTIVKTYGTTANRLTDSDIDLTNFSAFAAANTAPIGMYLSDKTNVLEACQQLAGSVGAQVTMDRTGLLKLLRIDFPPSGTPRQIGKKDMVEMTLSVDSREPVQASVQIGYNKNWTVQNSLQTVIPEEHKSLYEQEWLTATQSDSTVANKYKLLEQPNQKDTMLLTTSDANAEATRRLNISKVQRTTYKFTGFVNLFDLKLGDPVTITHTRYNMQAGVTGVVVGLEPDWVNMRIVVKVMV